MLRIAIGQVNVTVGALDDNARRMTRVYARAVAEGAQLVVMPEMAVSGYPPEDLLHYTAFIDASMTAARKVAAATGSVPCIYGAPWRNGGNGGGLLNAALVAQDGEIKHVYGKQQLPNYGVFDEVRYFTPGEASPLVNLGGYRIGLSVCEDAWVEGPLERWLGLRRKGKLDLVVNISGSPFYRGKQQERETAVGRLALAVEAPLIYANLVGGQDELIFDGRSMVLGPDGRPIAMAAAFHEDTLHWELARKPQGTARVPVRLKLPPHPRTAAPVAAAAAQADDPIADLWRAVVLGTRDYVLKSGFSQVVLGLSGGIDSALVAAIAAEAFGPGNVWAYSLPTRFNAPETRSDARLVAASLDIHFDEISIEELFRVFLTALDVRWKGQKPSEAEENLQSRIRGNLLMAESNKFGRLLLGTSNKSELSMGYGTLYGDMAGAYVPLKDVYKTEVFELARFYNRMRGVETIPVSIIEREPSAELRPSQRDTDSLPPYPLLDAALEYFIEGGAVDDLQIKGLTPERIRSIHRAVTRAEFKRRQAPPGPKVTTRAFGRDRRMPLANGFTFES